MKLLKKLLSSIVILFLVLTVFFSTLAVGLFVYGEVSGQQLIPEFHTVQDAKRWLKSVGESTNIPLLSSYLSSIKTTDTQINMNMSLKKPKYSFLITLLGVEHIMLYTAPFKCGRELFTLFN